MVQSLGISVGNLNSYVAAGQGGGIEILLNEYSSRATPSMVGFTDKIRYMGVDASQNITSNLKNTIYDIMLLLGKSYKDIVESNLDKNYQFKLEEAKNGQALVVVKYLGEVKKFSITQILAMLFTKLRSIANDSTDCVISCPQFYNDIQKAALYEAALIAGLNPLQIISDMSAIIMNYVYYRTTNKENTDKFIAFINFGQSNLQTCVAWLKPGKDMVKILASESESVGGKDFDQVLANYFITEHNLKLTPKAHLRLLAACEKLKKNLSSNSNDLPIHVESLVSEDKDFTARIDRAAFESLCRPIFHKVESCLRKTLKAYQDTIVELIKRRPQEPVPVEQDQQQQEQEQKEDQQQEDAPHDADMAVEGETPKETPKENPKGKKQSKKVQEDDGIPKDVSLTVELVGGSTRIPAIKHLIQEVFQVAPSTTLNTDEAVARGCVLHCATLHPGIKVSREVKILDSESFFKKGNTSCDKDDRRVELELIVNDKKFRSFTEARNNLEEYIYNERANLEEGDQYLAELSSTLDWIWSDEGEEATEEEYNERLSGLKKIKESRLSKEQPEAKEPVVVPMETANGPTSATADGDTNAEPSDPAPSAEAKSSSS